MGLQAVAFRVSLCRVAGGHYLNVEGFIAAGSLGAMFWA